MQILSAKPLIKEFREASFREESVGPYFLGYMILLSLNIATAGIFVETAWDIASNIAIGVLGIAGIFYLKEKNGGTFGDSFLAKYFALGWVVSIKMLLIGFAAIIPFMCMVVVLVGYNEDAVGAAAFFYTLLWIIGFYYWLGELYAEAREEK